MYLRLENLPVFAPSTELCGHTLPSDGNILSFSDNPEGWYNVSCHSVVDVGVLPRCSNRYGNRSVDKILCNQVSHEDRG